MRYSQLLGNFPKLCLVINYEGFPKFQPETEIFIQENEIDEENASNEIDRDGNQSSQVPSGLSCNLLLEDRVCMQEGQDQATADYDPCSMLKHRLDQYNEKEGNVPII